MKDKNSKQSKQWISFRVHPEEYEIIKSKCAATTSANISEYARKVLLQQPVKIKFHNESADHFLNEMIGLKKELQAIGINYNQVVKKLHTLRLDEEIKYWLQKHEQTGQDFFLLTEKIYLQLHQIHHKWSADSPAIDNHQHS